MAFKIDTKKFKKVGGDESHTMMRDDKGHELKIAHAPLDKATRAALQALPVFKTKEPIKKASMQKSPDMTEAAPQAQLAEGGNVEDDEIAFARKRQQPSPTPTPDASAAPVSKEGWNNFQKGYPGSSVQQKAKGGRVDNSDPTQRHLMPGDALPNSIEKGVVNQAKKRLNMADGGDVPQDQQQQNPNAPITINLNATPQQPQPGSPLYNGNQDQSQAIQTNQKEPTIIPSPGSMMGGTSEEDIAKIRENQRMARAQAAAPQSPPINSQTPDGAPMQLPPETANDPYGVQAYTNQYMQGMGQKAQGTAGEAIGLGQQGTAEATAERHGAAMQLQNAANYGDAVNSLDQERQAHIQYIQEHPIDANHYFHQMGTGQKIATAIGLIIGGLGGNDNSTQRFIQNQIQNDITAQQSNLGEQNNLLSANLHQFGNIRDAADMTRVMTNDAIVNQVRSKLAGSQDALAMARGNQLIGQLNMDSSGIVSRNAMYKTLLGGMQNGTVPPSAALHFVPKEDQPQATKELAAAMQFQKARDNALSVFDQVAKINTLGNRIGSPIQSKQQLDALRDNAATMLARDEAGRVNEYEFKAAQKIFGEIGGNAQTNAIKRAALDRIASMKMNFPTLQKWGIQLPQSRYGAGGQKTIQMGPPVSQ